MSANNKPSLIQMIHFVEPFLMVPIPINLCVCVLFDNAIPSLSHRDQS